MDLYVVGDFTISALQSEDLLKNAKVERGLQIVEKLVQEVNKEEVSVHFIVMLNQPIVAKSCLESSEGVRTSFAEALKNTTAEFSSDYAALKETILAHRTGANFEVVILTDLAENMNDIRALQLPCLLRFVLLTDPDSELLSEYLVAQMECISLQCGVEGGLGSSPARLDPATHFPIVFGGENSAEAIGSRLAREERTFKKVVITISPGVSLQVDATPGLPKRVVVLDEEAACRKVAADQPPAFKVVGSVETNAIVKMGALTDLIHQTLPTELDGGENGENAEMFKVITEALCTSGLSLILLHSSGEEALLRVYRPMVKPEGDEAEIGHGLAIQFYSAQSIPLPHRTDAEYSYAKNQQQIYWSDGYDLQAEASKVVRKLKKEHAAPVPLTFYEELLRILRFGSTLTFDECAAPFADFMEKKGGDLQLQTNPHLVQVLQWLRSPGGFSTASEQVPKHLEQLQKANK
ncbi:hypothetical protein M3Y99_00034300 [Aphelenchoides fujianensis]|nr:hypothetical protein M3Y99_00034300 [Aphelenchoides fujianensis]